MDEIKRLIGQEEKRQKEGITLIPSENYVSPAVAKASGSIFMSKYSEGYPGKRYYQGNSIVDEVEKLAQERAKELFKVPQVNVQAYSGSTANTAVLFALLEPGDTICGLKLSAGGHLTHGHPAITFSGKYFRSVGYDVNKSGKIDFGELEKTVKKERPKLIFAGTTAYPYEIDFKKFAEIAEICGAYLVADISHIVGLIVAGVHPAPTAFADCITTTTHKTLRGPRGAIILVTPKGLKKDPELAGRIDRAVFPGLQGGPHDNTTAAIAVCLEEAKTEKFRQYIFQVVKNAQSLAKFLRKEKLKVIGTENHLMLLDFSDFGGGTQVSHALEKAGIYTNKNSIPHDPNPPFYPSGVRVGTPAVTTRGMKEAEMELIGRWIGQVVNLVGDWKLPKEQEKRAEFIKEFKNWADKNKELLMIKKEVTEFSSVFPLYR